MEYRTVMTAAQYKPVAWFRYSRPSQYDTGINVTPKITEGNLIEYARLPDKRYAICPAR